MKKRSTINQVVQRFVFFTKKKKKKKKKKKYSFNNKDPLTVLKEQS